MKVKMIKKSEEEDQEEKEEEVGAGSDQYYIGQWLDKNQIDFCSTKRKFNCNWFLASLI